MLELREDTDTPLSGASFDKVECTQWVGETYLAATASTLSSAVGKSEFIRAWKDCLPESWREEAAVSKLPVSRSLLLTSLQEVVLTVLEWLLQKPRSYNYMLCRSIRATRHSQSCQCRVSPSRKG